MLIHRRISSKRHPVDDIYSVDYPMFANQEDDPTSVNRKWNLHLCTLRTGSFSTALSALGIIIPIIIERDSFGSGETFDSRFTVLLRSPMPRVMIKRPY